MAILWAVGDGACGSSDALAVANMVAADRPDAFVYLGDVYESGTAAEFEANYRTGWGQLDPICFPIPGNHDFGNYAQGYKPYWDAAARPSEPYYAENLAGWRLLFLNSEEPMDPLSEQYKWAEQQLPGPAGRKTIAFWHRPRYCSGSHGDAADTDYLWQLLAPHCALVLSGHAHVMQHFRPDATGCVQVISGAGGRALYAEIPTDPRLEWCQASGFGAVRLALGDDSVDVRYVAETGRLIWQTTVAAV
jgi:predicted phosphodiesterase